LERGLGFLRGGEIGRPAECRARQGLWPELEGDPDMRARHVSGRREEERTPSGFCPAGPRVEKKSGPKWSPTASFLFSYFFSLFYFLISELFHIFCKFGSNHFKQNPKIFYCSLQCFKIVINQVSKIKYVFPIKFYMHGIKVLLA
jgi:hypothetical protein